MQAKFSNEVEKARAMRNVAEETFNKLAAACEGKRKTGLVQS